MKLKQAVVLLIVAFLMLGVCIGYVIGAIKTEVSIRRDAVRAGVAEYYINTNTLEKEFRWITNRVEGVR